MKQINISTEPDLGGCCLQFETDIYTAVVMIGLSYPQMRLCGGRRRSGSRRWRSLSPSAVLSLILPGPNTSTSCASRPPRMTSLTHRRRRLSRRSLGWVTEWKSWCGRKGVKFHLSKWQHPVVLIHEALANDTKMRCHSVGPSSSAVFLLIYFLSHKDLNRCEHSCVCL